jgi:hypothetical protein
MRVMSMKKQQQGFVMMEMFSMVFFMTQFKVTDVVLGPLMIGLAFMAIFFKVASRSGVALKK